MNTLYISTTSPYTRMLLWIAQAYQLDLALEFVLPWEGSPALLQVNPFSQVPTLLLANGDVITETPLIIQALAPQVLSDNTDAQLPKIAKALTITSQGVRAYATRQFGVLGQPEHPFVARSVDFLQEALAQLPPLVHNPVHWGDRLLLCALIWIEIRLPEVFVSLSAHNQQIVHDAACHPVLQKFTAESLQHKPKNIRDL